MSAGPNAAERAAGWPARCRDLEGLRVRLRRDCSNGLGTIPAGTVGIIKWAPSGWHRIDFLADGCGECGFKPHCGGLTRRDLEPIVDNLRTSVPGAHVLSPGKELVLRSMDGETQVAIRVVSVVGQQVTLEVRS
jgi:hypothetical protein